MSQLTVLSAASITFPPLEMALENPNGLLAAGGDLSPERLLEAYRSGIFPWYEVGQPLLWWSPDPRAVLFPDDFHPSRSLSKLLRQNRFDVYLDRDFEAVIRACSEPRDYAEGTWITPQMVDAYIKLHQLGAAHSIEVYLDEELAGGLYGIGMGCLFFGESMFHRKSDASKVAFAFLVRLLSEQGCPMIDCQMSNDHLSSLGAVEVPRSEFADLLESGLTEEQNIDWAELPSRLSPW